MTFLKYKLRLDQFCLIFILIKKLCGEYFPNKNNKTEPSKSTHIQSILCTFKIKELCNETY